MPRKWIDKKTATHFTLVHRPQNDPLIHDESAPSMVLNPVQRPNATKSKALDDLASELGADAEHIRDNEGEAANYGVYYDDTEYDYMQHLRDIGQGSGDAIFVEANPVANKGKGKQQPLDEALRKLDLQNSSEDLLDRDILPNKNLERLTYQAQQDVPDAIAGFQPDMDPRLREVLEALEDDAYVDDDEEIFQELAKDAQPLDQSEFEDEDDGWESDRTAKPAREFRDEEVAPQLVDAEGNSLPRQEGPSDDWLEDFKKFKSDQKTEKKPKAAPARSEMQSSIWTTTTNGGQRKKRAGAMTNPSNYSMTSSSIYRTEQMGILDARFEKLDEEYNGDMDDLGSVSGISAVSGVSSVTGPLRSDFDGLMDEFLDSYSMHGKKRIKKGKWGNGIEQLDEIRKGLGPAKLRPSIP
ncbi:Low temperature viability protein [Podospora didyma]|uniref:Low temperature viability protein n=1 Tax=Podospora didyma TaxID=330526 RepID=A0AAE0KJX8_9PEZI|nr:Low temperature viability protein [Podospora didyma]